MNGGDGITQLLFWEPPNHNIIKEKIELKSQLNTNKSINNTTKEIYPTAVTSIK